MYSRGIEEFIYTSSRLSFSIKFVGKFVCVFSKLGANSITFCFLKQQNIGCVEL